MSSQQLVWPAEDQANQHPAWMKAGLLSPTPEEPLLSDD